MKNKQALKKAFEINKDTSIYGAFAEIGAGQETVNFFYHAGLASKTVAKSMSAYDMTVSDAIYGKQKRYVCQDRLQTMLSHDYQLLKKRLEEKKGKSHKFFVYAATSSTGSLDKKEIRNCHAWLGLKFQEKPGSLPSQIYIHIHCLDKKRLDQHEALGIFGVNLIHSCFRKLKSEKDFVKGLKESLIGNKKRIKIEALIVKGSAFKNFKLKELSLESLKQGLSQISVFSSEGDIQCLSDLAFDKQIVILQGDRLKIKDFIKNKAKNLKKLRAGKDTLLIECRPIAEEVSIKNSNQILTMLVKDCKKEAIRKEMSFYCLKPAIFY